MRLFIRILIAVSICSAFGMAGSIDTDKIADLVGYTIVAATNVSGSFEGADYDRAVKLDNGLAFEFRTYHYHYAYHPAAIVFAKVTSAEALRKMGIANPAGITLTEYKLLIDDEIYDVRRVP